MLAGVRDPAAGERLSAEAQGARLTALTLDVTDAEQIAAAASVSREQARRARAGSAPAASTRSSTTPVSASAARSS